MGWSEKGLPDEGGAVGGRRVGGVEGGVEALAAAVKDEGIALASEPLSSVVVDRRLNTAPDKEYQNKKKNKRMR